MEKKIYYLLLYLLIIFIPINLLKDLFVIPLTIICGGSILLIINLLLLKKFKRIYLIILIVPIMISILNTFFTYDVSTHIRYFFNWYSLVSILSFITNAEVIENIKKSYLEQEKRIHFLCNIIFILTVILYFIPQCHSSGWWGLQSGFTAFTVSHAVSVCMVVLTLLDLVYLSNNKKYGKFFLIKMFIYTYFLLQTGARVYLISMIVLLIIFLFRSIESSRLRFSIILLIIFSGIIIFPFTSFVEKIRITLSYQINNNVSLVNALTSGRSMFWVIDFKYFFKSNLIILLIGKGFSFSFYINSIFYHMEIFSHNVFLETLLSVGLYGFSCLIYLLKKLQNLAYDKLSFFTIFIYTSGVGFLNGLIDSQLYCFSIIFLVLLFDIFAENALRKGEINEV